ncbi:MAG: methyl-accepting chemotaxis protein [Anaeromyxobacteraceae bacterium]
MLRGLGFRQKVLLFPATATVAFLVLFAANQALGASTEAVLKRVEREYVPALEQSRDLEDVLGELQRALQNAVAAEDAEAVEETSHLRARFHERLALLEHQPADVPVTHKLGTDFDALWSVAREASTRMIARTATDELLQDTSRRFAVMRDDLAEHTKRERAELAGGLAEVRSTHRTAGITLGVGTIAAVLLLALLARSVVHGVVEPVVALSRAAKRVAEGDLAVAAVAVESQDELGELTRSFAAMVEKLRTLPASLAESVEELAGAVREMESVSSVQGAALEAQGLVLSRARATAERILRESHETSRRAETVLKIASQVEAFGDAAQLAARESVTGLGEISDQVKQVTGGIGQLARHTQTVGELVATMKRLASDSSELALSVSVEAARAGAAGGPLADASRLLKDLATRSSQTSARITRVLADADGALAGVSTLSEASKRRMENGLAQVRSSGDSLREITAVVQKSGKAARGIVTSVSEQGQAIAEISSDVLQLDKAMGEALQGSRRAQASAEALKRTAGRLTTLVRSFKV